MQQKPQDLKAMGPLPEEGASIKRQVNRLHKSRPSDLSYVKRRHHLEWYHIRKDRSPDWRRRRDRLEDIGVRVTRAIGPASTALIDPFNGSFMGDPPFVKVTSGGTALPEVVVIFATDPGHRLLETCQLVFEVFHSVVEYIQGGGLLPNHLPEVMSLKRDLSISQIDIQTRLRTLVFSSRNIHQRRSTMSRLDHLSNEAVSVGCSPRAASHF